jgi:HSP20 family protein
MTDLIPWKKANSDLSVRQREMDPFARMRQEMEGMFNGMLGDWTGPSSLFSRGAGSFVPSVEINETAKEIRVTAELPGLEEKDVEVSLLEGALWIKGEKRQEHEEEKGDVYTCERQYRAFQRMIQLPMEVEADKIKATFKKGVLKVTLPKTKEAQSKRRMIPIES